MEANESAILYSILNNSYDIFLAIDRDYKVTHLNEVAKQQFRQVLNIDIERGTPILEVVPKEIAKIWKNRYDKAFKGEMLKFEEQNDFGDGPYYSEVTISPIKIESNIIGISVVSRNITDIKRSEIDRLDIQSQLFHSSKLAAIGELATGVGHEVNNPLTIIIMKLQLMAKKFSNEIEPIKNHLTDIEKAANRIAKIVYGLKGFSQSNANDLEIIDLHTLIEDTVRLVEVIFQSESINIELSLDSSNSSFKCAPGQIQQVLINLLSNSKDAIIEANRDGRINISTKLLDSTIILEFSDNGAGMNDETMENLFESFYTTKSDGKGTGLGLSITKKIITEMGGSINVESSLGKGTKFTVRLPASEQMVSEGKEVQASQDLQPLAGTILIVDDEEEIRSLLAESLNDLLSNIETVGSGEEALSILKNKSFDIVIADYKMPKMCGDELAEKIRELKPNQKIILATGNLNNSEEELKNFNDEVLKPFELKTIYKSISKLLRQ